jgi:hypothetical protein
MTRTLELNCLVQGDDFRNAFPVKIGSHESVGTLKQAIRKENEHAFRGVDAHNLVLWKVSIAADGLVKQDPRIHDLAEDQSLLPTNRLSKVFSDALEEEHIHIVVRAPSTSEHRVIMACHIHNSLCFHQLRIQAHLLDNHQPTALSNSTVWFKAMTSAMPFRSKSAATNPLAPSSKESEKRRSLHSTAFPPTPSFCGRSPYPPTV